MGESMTKKKGVGDGYLVPTYALQQNASGLFLDIAINK
jgi:hypothetical protein